MSGSERKEKSRFHIHSVPAAEMEMSVVSGPGREFLGKASNGTVVSYSGMEGRVPGQAPQVLYTGTRS